MLPNRFSQPQVFCKHSEFFPLFPFISKLFSLVTNKKLYPTKKPNRCTKKNSTQPKSHWNERSPSQTGHYQHLRAHFHLSMRSPTELSTHTRALSIGNARSRICPGMGGKQKCKLQREKWLYLVLCSIYCTRCVCSSVDHVSLWSASCNKALKNIPHIWRKWIECVHPGKDTSAGNTSYIIHP